MIDVNNICLTGFELEKCREFSHISARSQQAIEFGQRTTKARSVDEIARDNLIGKIAEVAFSKMMKENYGIEVPLDFNYYPRGQWDKGFFDNIDHDWMVRFLEHDIADKNFIRYIKRFLIGGVMEDGKKLSTELGTVQGGLISPVLAYVMFGQIIPKETSEETKKEIKRRNP